MGFGRIWLIGGTQESAHIVRELHQRMLSPSFLGSNSLGSDLLENPLPLPCTITVTTESARSLYPVHSHFAIRVGALTPNTLTQFISAEAIIGILDASHPYAVEISQTAIALAQQHHLPYLRYERPTLLSTHSPTHPLTHSPTFPIPNPDDRILLTLGYRALHQFQAWQSRATLFARILPSVTALEAALSIGFTSDRLIALRPPISLELERALWQQWQISMVVTKASGQPGGEDVKRQLAAELGVKLVVIPRPVVDYPHQTSDLATAIQFCYQPYFPSDSPSDFPSNWPGVVPSRSELD